MITKLPNDVDYRSYPAVSQSDLKRAWHEPELYYQESIAKTRSRVVSEPMRLGANIEHFVKHDELPCDWVVIPDDVLASNGARLGNKWKEWAAAQPAGSVLIKQSEVDEQLEACQGVAKQIDAHELAKIATGRHLPTAERLRMWNQRFLFPYEDVEMKCEMDVFSESARLVCDLKSADDIDAGAFMRKCLKFGYDVQAYLYTFAAAMVCECSQDEIDYVFVVVRSGAPNNVETYRAPPEMIELGKRKFGAYLDHFKRCADSSTWRSRTHGQLIDLVVPSWAFKFDSYLEYAE